MQCAIVKIVFQLCACVVLCMHSKRDWRESRPGCESMLSAAAFLFSRLIPLSSDFSQMESQKPPIFICLPNRKVNNNIVLVPFFRNDRIFQSAIRKVMKTWTKSVQEQPFVTYVYFVRLGSPSLFRYHARSFSFLSIGFETGHPKTNRTRTTEEQI